MVRMAFYFSAVFMGARLTAKNILQILAASLRSETGSNFELVRCCHGILAPLLRNCHTIWHAGFCYTHH